MIDTIAVCLLLFLYVWADIGKVSNFTKTSTGLTEKFKKYLWLDIPQVGKLALAMVIILNVIAPLIIILSLYRITWRRVAQYALIWLIFFTGLATYLYHVNKDTKDWTGAVKNLSIIGGLLLLYTHLTP